MSDAALLSLSVDRLSERPLFHQLYEDLRAQILSGRLRPNSKLPPTRQFACELGLSRSTVTAAYDQLVSEGYARGRRGSGIFVCELPENCLQTATRRILPRPDGGRRRPAEADPEPFRQGVPDMRLFPYESWAKAVARVSRSAPRRLILSDDCFGDYDLRIALALHLAEWRGLAAAPEQIMVTSGAAGALELIFRALAGQGDAVALEDPGYPPIRRIAETMGLRPVWMPVDAGGADPQGLSGPGPAPKLIILTPSHQFPLGGAMPLARRLDFLDHAERSGGYIVEDDFDSEFRYAGRPIPAMAGMKDSGRVLYVGSFSKVFSAHLRLGFLVIPDPLVERFRRTIAAYGVGASIMPQRPLADFLQSGEFHRHIRRMRRIYGARRVAFFDLVDRELGGLVTYTDHQAGMTVLLKLPDGFDDRAIARRAADVGVTLQPASDFYAERPRKPGLLAGFSAFEPEQMAAPMQALAKILGASDPRPEAPPPARNRSRASGSNNPPNK